MQQCTTVLILDVLQFDCFFQCKFLITHVKLKPFLYLCQFQWAIYIIFFQIFQELHLLNGLRLLFCQIFQGLHLFRTLEQKREQKQKEKIYFCWSPRFMNLPTTMQLDYFEFDLSSFLGPLMSSEVPNKHGVKIIVKEQSKQ